MEKLWTIIGGLGGTFFFFAYWVSSLKKDYKLGCQAFAALNALQQEQFADLTRLLPYLAQEADYQPLYEKLQRLLPAAQQSLRISLSSPEQSVQKRMRLWKSFAKIVQEVKDKALLGKPLAEDARVIVEASYHRIQDERTFALDYHRAALRLMETRINFPGNLLVSKVNVGHLPLCD
jgi:hypothetical protein